MAEDQDQRDETTEEEAEDQVEVAATDDSEAEEWRNQALRFKADLENFKRRSGEESARNVKVARLAVVLEFLPVIDNFDRAFSDVPQDIQESPWYGGVNAIKSQFESILKGLGIERIDTVGKPFDPNLHEAISHEESDQYEADTVSEEFEAGYRLGEDVIRHARVKVSSGNAAHPGQAKSDPGSISNSNGKRKP